MEETDRSAGKDGAAEGLPVFFIHAPESEAVRGEIVKAFVISVLRERT